MKKFLNSRTWVLLGLMGLALMAPSLAFATPISITNNSFEDDVADVSWDSATNKGQWNGAQGSITGWAISSTTQYGTWKPETLSYLSLPGPVNVAWSNGGTISQVLANTLQPGDYSLKAYVGRRGDLTAEGYPNWPGYAVQLYAGVHLLGQESFLTPVEGSFVLSTVNYHATGTDPYLGQFLEIRLISNGTQVNFDQVTLDYVPLPPTVLLLGSGLLGLVGLRRFRKS